MWQKWALENRDYPNRVCYKILPKTTSLNLVRTLFAAQALRLKPPLDLLFPPLRSPNQPSWIGNEKNATDPTKLDTTNDVNVLIQITFNLRSRLFGTRTGIR